jgi:hypothetical protein
LIKKEKLTLRRMITTMRLRGTRKKFMMVARAEKETNLAIIGEHTKLRPLAFFRNISSSHGAQRWPEDSDTNFKDEESNEDDQLILMSKITTLTLCEGTVTSHTYSWIQYWCDECKG